VVYKGVRPRTDLEKTDKKDVYTYNPEGKTDPFAPFIVEQERSLTQLESAPVSDQLMKMLSLLADLKEPKTELQRIGINELVLTSIVKTDEETVAMVRGPSGVGYMLRKGTAIGKNGGVVEEIVSEETETPLGKQMIRKVVIKEPYLDREGKLQYKDREMRMAGSESVFK
jgi:type IV pilus assembly protein PilP